MSVPLCAQCAHYFVPRTVVNIPLGPVRVIEHADLARCARTDVVNGSGRAGEFCRIERSFGGCGPRGNHFAPILPPPPKPRRWWQWRRA